MNLFGHHFCVFVIRACLAVLVVVGSQVGGTSSREQGAIASSGTQEAVVTTSDEQRRTTSARSGDGDWRHPAGIIAALDGRHEQQHRTAGSSSTPQPKQTPLEAGSFDESITDYVTGKSIGSQSGVWGDVQVVGTTLEGDRVVRHSTVSQDLWLGGDTHATSRDRGGTGEVRSELDFARVSGSHARSTSTSTRRRPEHHVDTVSVTGPLERRPDTMPLGRDYSTGKTSNKSRGLNSEPRSMIETREYEPDTGSRIKDQSVTGTSNKSRGLNSEPRSMTETLEHEPDTGRRGRDQSVTGTPNLSRGLNSEPQSMIKTLEREPDTGRRSRDRSVTGTPYKSHELNSKPQSVTEDPQQDRKQSRVLLKEFNSSDPGSFSQSVSVEAKKERDSFIPATLSQSIIAAKDKNYNSSSVLTSQSEGKFLGFQNGSNPSVPISLSHNLTSDQSEKYNSNSPVNYSLGVPENDQKEQDSTIFARLSESMTSALHKDYNYEVPVNVSQNVPQNKSEERDCVIFSSKSVTDTLHENYNTSVLINVSQSVSENNPKERDSVFLARLSESVTAALHRGRSVSDATVKQAREDQRAPAVWSRQRETDRSLTEVTPVLDFPPTPIGDPYHIRELRLTEGWFLFSFVGTILQWIQPFDFPVEMVRDTLWRRLSLVNLVTESLKVEAGFLACLSAGVLLSLTAPGLVVVHACCRLLRRPQPPAAPGWDDVTDEDSSRCSAGCKRRSLIGLVYFLLLLAGLGIAAMFLTNEQLSAAVRKTPSVLHVALTDATVFVRNTHFQLHFLATQPLDQTLDTCYADLDSVEELLGRPIQRDLASETGVDVALDALVDVSTRAREFSASVDSLQRFARETRDQSLETRERLGDLRQQIDIFRRQLCPAKDRPLCMTIDTTGLDVVLRLDEILGDESLGQLRALGGDNLTIVTSQARAEFQFIPLNVEKDTRLTRNVIRDQLRRQRTLLDNSVWSLEVVTRDLTGKIEEARDEVLRVVRRVTELEQWRWLIAFVASVCTLFIWVLLFSGLCCTCCSSPHRTGATLLAALVFVCLLTTALWALGLAALLLGGHGEVFICRPLHDEPDFDALTRMVDNPGVLYQRPGFFSNLLYKNETLDVSVREALQQCQENSPSYQAFRLDKIFDIEKSSEYRNWGSLRTDLDGLRVNLSGVQLLKPELQFQLQQLLQASAVNLTKFRAQLAGPVTGKDLISLANQLDSVANQISDLSTASRVETLASRTRNLLDSHVQVLENRKENLVYQLTAIELNLQPLQRQVNQSLSHLKTIQYYIDNQGALIARRRARNYTDRLVGYLGQYRRHVLYQALHSAAPCRAVWDIFHALRLQACRHLMDPLNGFWFATIWSMLLYLAATPPTLRLLDYYRDQKTGGGLLNSGSTDSQSENQQPSSWQTPGSQAPDEPATRSARDADSCPQPPMNLCAPNKVPPRPRTPQPWL